MHACMHLTRRLTVSPHQRKRASRAARRRPMPDGGQGARAQTKPDAAHPKGAPIVVSPVNQTQSVRSATTREWCASVGVSIKSQGGGLTSGRKKEREGWMGDDAWLLSTYHTHTTVSRNRARRPSLPCNNAQNSNICIQATQDNRTGQEKIASPR